MSIKRMREDFDSSMEPPDDPTIVCLCGSGRFREAFEKAEFDETVAGRIVLTIGCNTKDVARDGSLEHLKPMLDELHKRKIDISDEILVLNVGGYIGESTKSEIEYAKQHGKKIRYLAPQPAPVPTLVEAVSKILEYAVHHPGSFADELCVLWDRLGQSLAREKKRQELLQTICEDYRRFLGESEFHRDHHLGECDWCDDLFALDAFDKDGGK